MHVLFAHPSFPAQFKYLAPGLAKVGHDVVFVSSHTEKVLPRVRQEFYSLETSALCNNPLLKPVADAIRYGVAARDVASRLAKSGFYPEIIVVHPSWGDALFFKDVFPRSHIICFLEFFANPDGELFTFEKQTVDSSSRGLLRMHNLHVLASLNEASWNITPTEWQKQLFPSAYHQRITTIHEGINVQKFAPASSVELICSEGIVLRSGMEIVTFVARYLEPMRGLESFIKAAEIVLKRRPNAHVVIVGHEDGGYGPPAAGGRTHKQVIMADSDLDKARVHFLGCVGQSVVVKVLQLSTVHVFLTHPFIISYSILEALACSCVLVASNTGPCREIVKDGENGLLANFFDHQEIASLCCDVLANPKRFSKLGKAGRELIGRDYNALVNLNRQIALVTSIAET